MKIKVSISYYNSLIVNYNIEEYMNADYLVKNNYFKPTNLKDDEIIKLEHNKFEYFFSSVKNSIINSQKKADIM